MVTIQRFRGRRRWQSIIHGTRFARINGNGPSLPRPSPFAPAPDFAALDSRDGGASFFYLLCFLKVYMDAARRCLR